jgi:hypothetical protein
MPSDKPTLTTVHFKEQQMSITIELKWNYGSCASYPVCETSKQFAQIAGTKTLTQEALRIIKAMGYTINQTTKEITL